jgi:hypothetical protein
MNIKTQRLLSVSLSMDNTFSASIFPRTVLVNFICTEIIFVKDVQFGICSGDIMFPCEVATESLNYISIHFFLQGLRQTFFISSHALRKLA